MIGNQPIQKVSKPTVEYFFTREDGFLSYQVPNFKCVFPFLTHPEPDPYLYQIYWYTNGDIVYVTEPLRKENFSRTYLNERHGLLKMGIMVILYIRFYGSFLHYF